MGSERTVRILVQTTIPAAKDDWSVERFGLLARYLASLRTADMRFEVTTTGTPSAARPRA